MTGTARMPKMAAGKRRIAGEWPNDMNPRRTSKYGIEVRLDPNAFVASLMLANSSPQRENLVSPTNRKIVATATIAARGSQAGEADARVRSERHIPSGRGAGTVRSCGRVVESDWLTASGTPSIIDE